MYVDCDVEFKKDIESGFDLLRHFDFAVAQERLAIRQLYNRPRAAWYHNIIERDATIEEVGADGYFPFINSGVFFFKKNQAVQEVFARWREEWQRWQEWDEQASLLRALVKSKARFFVLSEAYNYPHDDDPDAVIVHLYGKGAARSEANDQTHQ